MQKRRAAQPADVDDARDFRWAVTVWVMIFMDDVSAVAFMDVLRGDGNSFLKDLRRDEWVRGGEQGYHDRGWYTCIFGCGGSCIHLGKCRDAMDVECTHRRCTFVASLIHWTCVETNGSEGVRARL